MILGFAGRPGIHFKVVLVCGPRSSVVLFFHVRYTAIPTSPVRKARRQDSGLEVWLVKLESGW